MVSVIAGKKGVGKTKTLIAKVTAAAQSSQGHVICVEQEPKLTFEIPSGVRLVATNDYGVQGFDALYGFLSGLVAGDHDVSDVFVDATLAIAGRDLQQLAAFLGKLSQIALAESKQFVLTVSADPTDLPAEVQALLLP